MSVELAKQASEFAIELGKTLRASLPHAPSVDAMGRENRFVVQPQVGGNPTKVPLFVKDRELASLDFASYLDLDSSGSFLKNVRTDISVYSVLDRTPLFHLDYRSDMNRAPRAHWQFHAERGALTHLLTLANENHGKRGGTPHVLSKLHFPVGGERFRPCLEDVIQFLIVECRVDHCRNWRSAVSSGRERWRRLQFRTIVRDLQEEAAEVLRREGWKVERPTRVMPESGPSLQNW